MCVSVCECMSECVSVCVCVYMRNIVAHFSKHSQRVEFNWAEIETEAETSRCQANSVVAVCLPR